MYFDKMSFRNLTSETTNKFNYFRENFYTNFTAYFLKGTFTYMYKTSYYNFKLKLINIKTFISLDKLISLNILDSSTSLLSVYKHDSVHFILHLRYFLFMVPVEYVDMASTI